MKKGRLLGIVGFLIVSLFMINLISAGIYFSNPDSYYNLGDIIETGVEVDPILEGFLKIDLVCDGGTVNVFNGLPDEEGKVNIKFPLTFSYIEENSGSCYFYGDYFGLNGKSRDFEISKALDVILDIDSLFIKPGEEFVVSGRANRLNGQGINGEVEITIPLLNLDTFGTSESEVDEIEDDELACECDLSCAEELNNCLDECEDLENDNETESCNVDCNNELDSCVEVCEEECVEEIEEVIEETEEEIEEINVDNGIFYGKVNEGIFSVSIKLDEKTPAGDYRIDVRAFEEDNLGKVSSEGLVMGSLTISQLLTNIDVALANTEVDPGEALNLKPMLLDQAGNPISDEVSVIIRDKESKRIFEKIVQSEDTLEFLVPTNLSSDYYDIEASSGDISSMKSFFVNEKAIVSFELRNNSLVVTNVGNIPYKKDVQVDLNGQSFVKKVNLELQEQQEFRLTGDGDYEVKITDGENQQLYSGVALTGKAIDVEAVKKGFVALNTPIIWIFFIIIIGAGILFLFRNILKKKSFAYPFTGIKSKLSGLRKKNVSSVPISKTTETVGSGLNLVKKAEQVLVLKGHKTKAAVIALKLKHKLNNNTKKQVNELLKVIFDKKGAVYEKDSYVIGVFSPLMTKTYHNEVVAAKTAELIQRMLAEYNKKFADKINLGIAINSGEIVNTIEDKKLKFTALGNMIPTVKRIAEASKGEILMTKEAHGKSGNAVKVIKKGDIYEVKNVLDLEKNKEFIDNFLKRVGTEKNKKGESGFSL